MTPVITIDGPAASGKSSVSREVARALGWSWVSTGAFYRGLAWAVSYLGVDPEEESQVAPMAASPDLVVRLTPESTHVFWGAVEITEDIRADYVGALASRVSRYPSVRTALLAAQRDCARRVPGLVAEGRDCGTVIFPTAQLKVYLTASEGARAQRRALQEGGDAAGLLASQRARDIQDSSRKTAPLRAADGALHIDSSEMDLKEVVASVLSEYRNVNPH